MLVLDVADVLTISEVMTPARQLFIYLLSHEKAYNMEVFRMVPIPVTTLTDLDGAECDADSDVSVACHETGKQFVFVQE